MEIEPKDEPKEMYREPKTYDDEDYDDEEEEIAFSPEDEEEVKKRLRALGYLD